MVTIMSENWKKRGSTATSGEEEGPSRKVARRSDEECGWSQDIHSMFVSAMYDVGMKHSSPSVILEHMTKKSPAITTERIKSHLQKYRASKQKSKQEFMDSYNSWLEKAKGLPPSVVAANSELLCGEGAAFLTYHTMMMDTLPPSSSDDSPTLQQQDYTYVGSDGGGAVHFPKLSEWEKQTPLGESMEHVSALLFSMTKQLTRERARKQMQQQQQQHQTTILVPSDSPMVQASSTMPQESTNLQYSTSKMPHRTKNHYEL